MRTDFTTKARDRMVSDGVHPTRCCWQASVAMKKLGFRFVGETTVLSFFQAIGIVNHHRGDCFAFQECEDALEAVTALQPSIDAMKTKVTL